MSCSDLRLKTLRWFFMRSTTLLKSSWSSANICFTWRNRGRQGGKENGRVEKGRERKSRDGRWTGQADPTWYPYRFPTMYIPTVAVVLQSESIAQSPGLNALATSVGAPWSQVRWSWKLTSELHWSCGIPRGQRGDYRRQGKRMKEGRWRGKDEGKRMKGRRWREEDEGKRMKGEDEGEKIMKGRQKRKGRREEKGWEGEKKEIKDGEERKLRASDHIQSQIQWLTQLPFAVCWSQTPLHAAATVSQLRHLDWRPTSVDNGHPAGQLTTVSLTYQAIDSHHTHPPTYNPPILIPTTQPTAHINVPTCPAIYGTQPTHPYWSPQPTHPHCLHQPTQPNCFSPILFPL